MSNKELDHYWDSIARELKLVPHIWEPWWELDELFRNAYNGDTQVWVVASSNKEIDLITFTSIHQLPIGRQVCVFLAFGRKVEECLPVLVATLQKFCKERRCVRLEVIGRSGWGKLLREYGLRPERHIFSINLTHGSAH